MRILLLLFFDSGFCLRDLIKAVNSSISDEFLDRMLSYGCNCFFDGKWQRIGDEGFGYPTDAYDSHCYRLKRCYQQLMASHGESCDPQFASYEYASIPESDDIFCSELNGECSNAICECDLAFANHFALFSIAAQDGFSSHSSEKETSCGWYPAIYCQAHQPAKIPKSPCHPLQTPAFSINYQPFTINEAVAFCESKGEKLFQRLFTEENYAENVALFRRSENGNPAVILEDVYFWIPFERTITKNGDILYVSLVENGLKSTTDLAEYYPMLINDNTRNFMKVVAENCLALKVTASSLSLAFPNCASTQPLTSCSAISIHRNDEIIEKNDDNSACEDGWIEDGNKNCLKVLPYNGVVPEYCTFVGTTLDIWFQLSYWVDDLSNFKIDGENCISHYRIMRESNEWVIYSDKNCEDSKNFICGKSSRAIREKKTQEIVDGASIPALITAQLTGNYQRQNILSCDNDWIPTGTGECLRLYDEPKDFQSALLFCEKQKGTLSNFHEYFNLRIISENDEFYLDVLSDSTGQLITSDGTFLDLPILHNSTEANKCGIYTFDIVDADNGTISQDKPVTQAGISLIDCIEEKPFICEKPTSSVQKIAFSFVSAILVLIVQKF